MIAAKRYGVRNTTAVSKEQLLALLFEAALASIRQGRAALEEERPVDAGKPLLKASNIVHQLLSTLNPEVAPELCKNLSRTYLFVWQRLIQASVKRDAVAAREAEQAFTPVADGFLQVLRGERAGT